MPRELRAAYLLRWTGSGYRLEDGLIAQYPSSIERLARLIHDAGDFGLADVA
jgi:hypothetical protein